LLAKLCAAVLMGCCGAAQAQFDTNRLWINPGFYSFHFDDHKGLRNPNPGVGFEYVLNSDWSATGGRFLNSDNALSSYLGVYYQPLHLGPFKFGTVGGVFNGYPKAFNGGWFPALLPVATWESGPVGLNLAWVPPISNRLYGAVSLQLKVRFSDGKP
jgi:hypothetical protein